MTPELQARILGRLKAAMAGPHSPAPRAAPEGAPETALDGDRFRQELSSFKRLPMVVGHASALSAPGDYVMEWVAGLPILVVRQVGGEVRGFLNICRHQGAMLVTDRCGRREALTCPRHSWRYALDGTLEAPRAGVLPNVGPEAHHLQPVNIAQRHGLLWAQLDGVADVASCLGPALDRDLSDLELATHRLFHTTVMSRRAHWRKVMDTVVAGHGAGRLLGSGGPGLGRPTTIVDDYGLHRRQACSDTRLASLDASAQVRSHTTLLYALYPNTLLMVHRDGLSHVSLVPMAVDHVTVVHRMLTPEGADHRNAERPSSFTRMDALLADHDGPPWTRSA